MMLAQQENKEQAVRMRRYLMAAGLDKILLSRGRSIEELFCKTFLIMTI
jgi:hypothetical protein